MVNSNFHKNPETIIVWNDIYWIYILGEYDWKNNTTLSSAKVYDYTKSNMWSSLPDIMNEQRDGCTGTFM